MARDPDPPSPASLSRRERQIMEIIHARGKGGASANDVRADLPNPPTRTSIRTLLRILEQKGHLTHVQEGREFVYQPVTPTAQVGRSALQNVLRAFFSGSLPTAIAAYLSDPAARLSPREARQLKELIDQAKKRGD